MPKQEDLCLWAYLGIFGIFAAKACHHQLHAMRAVTEVSPEDYDWPQDTEESEDDPPLESLARLAHDPNMLVRDASIRVVEDLVLRYKPYTTMLEHIGGDNKTRRDEGLACLQYITQKPLKIPVPYLATYKAVLKCLGKLHIEAYDFEIAMRKNGWGQRTKYYAHALTILIRLLSYNPEDAHRGGLLPWLESYPYGGYDSAEGRKKSVELLLDTQYDEEPMHSILLLAFLNEVIALKLRNCDWIDQETVDTCLSLADLGPMYYEAIFINPFRRHEVSGIPDPKLERSDAGLYRPGERVFRRSRRKDMILSRIENSPTAEAEIAFTPSIPVTDSDGRIGG